MLGILRVDDVRALVLARYRTAGFIPEDFSHRRVARQCIASAITAVEDWLESNHPRRDRERAELKALRRRLELELWV